MKSLISFVKNFINNKGLYIFSSSIIGKIAAFINTVIAINLLPIDSFGKITLIASVHGAIIPLSGLGSYQGVLRYGSLLTTDTQKSSFNQYMFLKGLQKHIIVIALFLLVGIFYSLKFEQISFILLAYSLNIISYLLVFHVQAEYRIRHLNKKYAYANILLAIGGLLVSSLFTLIWGVTGYLTGVILSPLLILLLLPARVKASIPTYFKKKNIWKYSYSAAFATVFHEIIFALEFLLLALYLSEHDLAIYKSAVLIPMNSAIIAKSFIETDFPKLMRNYKQPLFLKNYIINYHKLFFIISLFILSLFFFFSNRISEIFFKLEYNTENNVMFICSIGVCFTMLTRVLYGNLASIIGRPNWNNYFSIISIVALLFLSRYLIPLYGIDGAAISMTVASFIAGICSAIPFYNYLKMNRY